MSAASHANLYAINPPPDSPPAYTRLRSMQPSLVVFSTMARMKPTSSTFCSIDGLQQVPAFHLAFSAFG